MKKNPYLLLSVVILAAAMFLIGCDSSSESSYDDYFGMSGGICKIGGKIWLDTGPKELSTHFMMRI